MPRRSAWRTWRSLGLLVAGAGVALAAGPVVRYVRDAQSAPGIPPPVEARGPAWPSTARPIRALGRVEPKDGVLRIAGPSRPSVVIKELRIDTGDRVEARQVIAVLDTRAVNLAEVARLEAELANAELEYHRNEPLHKENVTSAARWDALRLAVAAARSALARARAESELDLVRAPVAGQVLKVHAREGERVGPQGIVELGQTDQMYAIAEVYETDVSRVVVGQKALVQAAPFADPLPGTVERIRPRVGKADVLGTDPAAKQDARVVEVEVRLADSAEAAGLTNLEVEIEILP